MRTKFCHQFGCILGCIDGQSLWNHQQCFGKFCNCKLFTRTLHVNYGSKSEIPKWLQNSQDKWTRPPQLRLLREQHSLTRVSVEQHKVSRAMIWHLSTRSYIKYLSIS